MAQRGGEQAPALRLCWPTAPRSKSSWCIWQALSDGNVGECGDAEPPHLPALPNGTGVVAPVQAGYSYLQEAASERPLSFPPCLLQVALPCMQTTLLIASISLIARLITASCFQIHTLQCVQLSVPATQRPPLVVEQELWQGTSKGSQPSIWLEITASSASASRPELAYSVTGIACTRLVALSSNSWLRAGRRSGTLHLHLYAPHKRRTLCRLSLHRIAHPQLAPPPGETRAVPAHAGLPARSTIPCKACLRVGRPSGCRFLHVFSRLAGAWRGCGQALGLDATALAYTTSKNQHLLLRKFVFGFREKEKQRKRRQIENRRKHKARKQHLSDVFVLLSHDAELSDGWQQHCNPCGDLSGTANTRTSSLLQLIFLFFHAPGNNYADTSSLENYIIA